MSYFPLKIELHYSYTTGKLTPFFEALERGQALASRCPVCSYVSFPPRLVCHQDHNHTQWHSLQGSGTVVEFTYGLHLNQDSVKFALIEMDGANNRTLGRLYASKIKKGDRVCLAAATEKTNHPIQSAVFKILS